MITPEKSDVDISKLFNWGREFSFSYDGQDITYFMRLPGDADINRSRVYGLRQSAELRRKLNDLESDERLAYIAEEGLLEKAQLENFLFISKAKELYSQVIREVDIPFPKEPKDDSSLETFEKYQQAVDSFPDRVSEEVGRQMNDLMVKEKRKISDLPKETLYSEYVKMQINEICEKLMSDKFKDMCIFFSTYEDSDYKVRLFTSVEEVQNLNQHIRDQLFGNYAELEMGIDLLKK